MQGSVGMRVEVDSEAEVGQRETAILEAGRHAMRAAVRQGVRQ
jgi:hypothetical protein